MNLFKPNSVSNSELYAKVNKLKLSENQVKMEKVRSMMMLEGEHFQHVLGVKIYTLLLTLPDEVYQEKSNFLLLSKMTTLG